MPISSAFNGLIFDVYRTNFCHFCSSALHMKMQVLTASSDDLSKLNRVIIASPQATENKILPAVFFSNMVWRVLPSCKLISAIMQCISAGYE